METRKNRPSNRILETDVHSLPHSKSPLVQLGVVVRQSGWEWLDIAVSRRLDKIYGFSIVSESVTDWGVEMMDRELEIWLDPHNSTQENRKWCLIL